MTVTPVDNLAEFVRAHQARLGWPAEVWEVMFVALSRAYQDDVSARQAALTIRFIKRVLSAWETSDSPANPSALRDIVERQPRLRARRGRPPGEVTPRQVFLCHWYLHGPLQRQRVRRGGTPDIAKDLSSLRDAWEDEAFQVVLDPNEVPSFPEETVRDALTTTRTSRQAINKIVAKMFGIKPDSVSRYCLMVQSALPPSTRSTFWGLGPRHLTRSRAKSKSL
jgi:hypothetical protein